MSALETYLKTAAETKGTWHKQAIQSVRSYIKISREEDVIAAIKLIRNQQLIRLLWEVGLSSTLQQDAIYQSKRIEQEAKGGI